MLIELFNKTKSSILVEKYISELHADYQLIRNKNYINQKLYNKFINYINNELSDFSNITLGFSHGDFTSWNLFAIDNNKLYVYDWEAASNRTPLWDLYHFHIFNYLRINKKNDNEIVKLLFNDYEVNSYIDIYLNKIDVIGSRKLYLAFFAYQLLIQYINYQILSTENKDKPNDIIDRIISITTRMLTQIVNEK